MSSTVNRIFALYKISLTKPDDAPSMNADEVMPIIARHILSTRDLAHRIVNGNMDEDPEAVSRAFDGWGAVTNTGEFLVPSEEIQLNRESAICGHVHEWVVGQHVTTLQMGEMHVNVDQMAPGEGRHFQKGFVMFVSKGASIALSFSQTKKVDVEILLSNALTKIMNNGHAYQIELVYQVSREDIENIIDKVKNIEFSLPEDSEPEETGVLHELRSVFCGRSLRRNTVSSLGVEVKIKVNRPPEGHERGVIDKLVRLMTLLPEMKVHLKDGKTLSGDKIFIKKSKSIKAINKLPVLDDLRKKLIVWFFEVIPSVIS